MDWWFIHALVEESLISFPNVDDGALGYNRMSN